MCLPSGLQDGGVDSQVTLGYLEISEFRGDMAFHRQKESRVKFGTGFGFTAEVLVGVTKIGHAECAVLC